MLRSKVVYSTLDKLYCDGCGEELTKYITLLSNPPQYKYECSCGFVQITSNAYPAIMFKDATGNSVI